MTRQPRITDLVPQRYGVISLIFLAGLVIVVALEGLYAWMPELSRATTDGRVAAFDLDGEGSIAVWFSSFTLALASAVALVVYSIRRQRVDDYDGRYRIWLWAAVTWLVMSVDETASLHEGFKELMTWLTGRRLMGDGSIWWVSAYLVVLGFVGTRLFLEMRACRPSSAALIATAACYATAVVAQLGWVMGESGARGVMVEEGAEMVGNLVLLLSMVLHTGHVLLESEGRLPIRPARVKRADTDATQTERPGRRWFRRAKVDAGHASPPQPVQRSSTTGTPSTTRQAAGKSDSALRQAASQARWPEVRKNVTPPQRSTGDDAYEFELGTGESRGGGNEVVPGETRRMTKAERKALRRQQREERDDVD